MTTTAPDIHVLSADSTREDVIEALGFACERAHHVPAIVARFDCNAPTEWDRAHDWLNALLDMLEDTRR